MTRFNDQNRSHRPPRQISGLISEVIGSLGLTSQYGGWWVVSNWPEIVGPALAEQSRADRFADGVLTVAVPDDAWRQQLAMQLETILRRIHSYPEGRQVKSIRLQRGGKRTTGR